MTSPSGPAQRLRERRSFRSVALALAGGLLVGLYAAVQLARPPQPPPDPEAVWTRLVDAEEVIGSLEPHLQRLSFSVSNLALPDFQGRQVFGDEVRWNRLSRRATAGEPVGAAVSVQQWEVSQESRVESPETAGIWSGVFDGVDYFEHASFQVVDGRFLDTERRRFETILEFTGMARTPEGAWRSMRATVTVGWSGVTGSPVQPPWRITEWHVEQFSTVETEQLLFVEALDDALPDLDDLRRARTSIHEQLVLTSLDTGRKPFPLFQRQSVDRHPGVSVVDLDGDGFDDVYAMARWGTNLFFHNQGDGTFEEIGAAIGLDIEDHSSSAIFADFDNDGDQDAFLGRTLARSVYLENADGRFVERDDAVQGGPLPYLVSSVSAADYDDDGLLDVYFSTYMAVTLQDGDLADVADYVTDDDLDLDLLREIRRSREPDIWLDLPGPRNVLVRNIGGGTFAVQTETAGLDVRRNTFQSTWVDFDDDGDQDVYLANDFAPNNLLRNDGNGRFQDVSEETGTTDLGFGMGASWGDYDNDGAQDLYVSNMYSKAGRRITAQLDYIDGGFAKAARGNSLLRNAGSRFDKVSGLAAPALMVERAGWSWGGQYADVDNDGYLDIHALSGYYTSPRPTGIPDL